MPCELAPKVETVEAREIEEEEGSSFTPRKDDDEGGDAVNEHQAGDAQEEQTEHQSHGLRRRTMPIEVEESMPEGDSGEELIPSTIEDEAKIIPPPAQHNKSLRLSRIFKTLRDTIVSLGRRGIASSLGTPLKCEKHPFLISPRHF